MANEGEPLWWFCGANSTDFLQMGLDSALYHSCFVNLVDACVHAFFLITATLVLVVLAYFTSLRHFHSKTLCVLPGHNVRYITFTCAFLVLLAWVGEGILTDLKRSGTTEPHLYIPPSLALISGVMSVVFYHYAEYWSRPKLAWLTGMYWILAIGAKVLVLLNLVHEDATGIDIMRFDVTVLLLIAYCLFFVVELNLLRTKITHSQYMDAQTLEDLQKTDLTFVHEYTNLFSRVTLNWLNWIFSRGYKQPLEMADLGSMSHKNQARYQYTEFLQAYENEKKRAAEKGVAPSLWKTQKAMYGRRILLAAALLLLGMVLSLIAPLGIGVIITYATKLYYGLDVDDIDDANVYDYEYVTVDEYFSNGFVMVMVIFIALTLGSITTQYGYYIMVMEGIHFRTALQCHVYEKTIRLASGVLTSGERTMGQMINHMSVDSFTVQSWYLIANNLWLIPTQVILLLFLLYSKLGYSALIGASVFLLTTPAQMVVGSAMTRAQRAVLTFSDERLKKCNELLQGITLLKLCGWEELFSSVIEDVRKKEVQAIMKHGRLVVAIQFVTMATRELLKLISFSAYSLVSPTPLTPDIAFAAYALFQLLTVPITMLPVTIGSTIGTLVSLSRLQKFFVADEIEERDDGRTPLSSGLPDFGEDFAHDDLTLETYKKENKSVTNYQKVNLTDDTKEMQMPMDTYLSKEDSPDDAPDEETSLLASKPSSVDVPEDVAIMVRNGKFSWKMKDPEPVLTDINLDIPLGKLTMIVGVIGSGKSSLLSAFLGEMTSVSGSIRYNRTKSTVAYCGQKAWLRNATLRDNILFGEPYDYQRYQKIVDACALQPDIDILPGGDKTEIGEKGINLSGGQKQRVSVARCMYSKADIIILDDPLSAVDVHVGRHLMAEGIKGFLKNENRTVVLVSHQLQYIECADKIVVMDSGKILHQGDLDEIAKKDPVLYASWQQTLNRDPEEDDECEAEPVEDEKYQLMKQISHKVGPVKAGATLIEQEERERGSVSWRVYMTYFRAAKLPLFVIALLLTVVKVTAMVFTDFWLALWSESGAFMANNISLEETEDKTNYWIGGYAGLTVVCICLALVTSAWFTVCLIQAAKRIHKALLRNVIRLPLRFFDTTPVGRILNRFSSDTQVIDMKLWYPMQSLFNFVFVIIAAVIINSIVSPLFILFFIPVFVGYVILQHYYIKTSRELQRLDSVSKSPVFAHFSESLGGLSTIRAYRMEQQFRWRLIQRIEYNNLAFINLQAGQRWVAIRLDFCGSLLVLISGLCALITSALFGVEPSLVGLALAYAVQVSPSLNFLMRQISECELQMNAVERVNHYTKVENEPYEGTQKPSSQWPTNGDIQYQDVAVRYANDLDPVLQNVTLEFKAGQKIGICGRTGSGKSSLALSLFRAVDTFQGRIVIDGIDISHVPLLTLRKRLAIIPQDPILFSGTIRFNLDPEGNKEDSALWEALEIAQLKSTVMELDQQLESEISEGGENFSVGQRQLFCLARAFLRKATILVMDEATASIDMKTDATLQTVLATAFRDRTVLIIAHRVSTILDSDMILVLSEGKVIELDTPENLLKNEDGAFTSLVKGKK